MLLKEKLIKLKNNNYELESNTNIKSEIFEMLYSIGVNDSQLRDELIYETFSYWILNNYISNDMLYLILKTILSEDYIFYKIGDSDNDSVFTRSFSMLLIPLILTQNEKYGFLNEKDIYIIKENVVLYLSLEKDLRGYVDSKGWAHAIAHAADTLNMLTKFHLNKEDYLEILNVIKNIICTKEVVFTNLEDERLVTVVMSIIEKKCIEENQFGIWVESFSDWKKTTIWHEEYKKITNIKLFLTSFYFRLEKKCEKEILLDYIKIVLNKISVI